jgi:glycosyltransferase involved in cell wall biosynthesis
MLRVPKLGEAEARVAGARLALVGKRVRPRLVHGHFLYEVGVAAVRLARSFGVPSVVTVHGTDARWLLQGGVQERFRARMLAAALAADRLVVVERGLADELIGAGVSPERVRVIPMGVDEDTFHPSDRLVARRALGVAADARLVLVVGRATPEKGVDVLERAVAFLPASVRVVVLGPSSRPSGRVEYAGPVPSTEVAAWFAASDVFCLPSLAEGSPVSVVEALASGRPVVASAVGGIPAQIEEGVNGLLVAPGDERALAAALENALARTWSAERLRESSRSSWWSEIAPKLDAVYEEIL